MIQWKLFKFSSLSADYLYKALKLRQDVFIIEQNCIYPDIDNLDPVSLHLYMYQNDEFTGYLRIVPPDKKFTEVSIGRIVIHPEFRKQKLGYKLVKKGIEIASDNFEGDIRIEAQFYLQNFYEKCGFIKTSEIYAVDGIDHIQMIFDNG